MANTGIFNAAALAAGTSALTQRTAALATTPDLVQAGAVFNDATRLLDGGLWSTPADSNNQPALLGMYQADIHTVLNDISGIIATPGSATVGGVAYMVTPADATVLSTVQGQLQTLLNDAPNSVGIFSDRRRGPE